MALIIKKIPYVWQILGILSAIASILAFLGVGPDFLQIALRWFMRWGAIPIAVLLVFVIIIGLVFIMVRSPRVKQDQSPRGWVEQVQAGEFFWGEKPVYDEYIPIYMPPNIGIRRSRFINPNTEEKTDWKYECNEFSGGIKEVALHLMTTEQLIQDIDWKVEGVDPGNFSPW